ncbi:MAG: UDP-3-O-(3-hydroxymyristoyl)glucosamine N-acyltransferase [Acidobacteria bacterium]|nr:UDP-3-O-(3-hydroxymyristoyl)glucosamine N-acyltransferase [Acidobacteriota bacterium]
MRWPNLDCRHLEEHSYTLQQLASFVNGQIYGNPELVIRRIQPFELAQEGDLTLADEKKYRERIGATGASAVIVAANFAAKELNSRTKSLLQVTDPRLAFARLLALFHPDHFVATGVSPLAHVSKCAVIAQEVSIYPFVYVGDNARIERGVTLYPGVFVGNGCSIGEDSTLYPNVVLYDRVVIGRRVRIHSGTVIGADGFGYVTGEGQPVKIPQTGTVVIEDDVEIGANTCIDRSTFSATVVEQGVKLDNLIQIGHNCRIGANTVMVAQVGIAGSVEVGCNCLFAGQVGVVHKVRIGDDVIVTSRTGITKDIPSGSKIAGYPAMDHRTWKKIEAITRRLPEIYQEDLRKKCRSRKAGKKSNR